MSSIVVELPDALKKGIEEFALREGSSVGQFLVSAAGEKLAAAQSLERLRSEGEMGKRKDFERYLAGVPNAPPIDGDNLE